MENDEKIFEHIKEALDKIKDNHLFHIEKDSAAAQADINWIKNLLWLFAVPIASGFIEQIYRLFHP